MPLLFAVMINSVHILQSGYGVKLQTLHQAFAIQYTKCIKMPDTLENGTKLIHNHHMKDRNRNNKKRTVISYPSKNNEAISATWSVLARNRSVTTKQTNALLYLPTT